MKSSRPVSFKAPLNPAIEEERNVYSVRINHAH